MREHLALPADEEQGRLVESPSAVHFPFSDDSSVEAWAGDHEDAGDALRDFKAWLLHT